MVREFTLNVPTLLTDTVVNQPLTFEIWLVQLAPPLRVI
jgi:hypothetical protein